MNTLLTILRILGAVFLGLAMYLAITILVLGTTMVLREGMLIAFKFDLYEGLKTLVAKCKPKKKERQVLNEATDEEWLKNRGRY